MSQTLIFFFPLLNVPCLITVCDCYHFGAIELKLGGGKMFLGLEIVNIQNENFPLSAGFCVHSFPDL